jgi:heat shock protein HslJ
LRSYIAGDSTSIPVPDGLTITAEFSATDISGDGGCNTYRATYVATSNGTITIGDIATTGRLCADDLNRAEAAYLAALEQAVSYSATTARLRIDSAASTSRLVFAPRNAPR